MNRSIGTVALVALVLCAALHAFAARPAAGSTAPLATADVAAPTAATLAVDSLSSSGATLRGEVNPRGAATAAWFEWGTDPDLSSPTLTGQIDLGAGEATAPVSSRLDHLVPGTTYYYRVAAQSEAGTARGDVDFFAPEPAGNRALVVNCADDVEPAPPGKMTIRAAVARVESGGVITFDPRLDGAQIDLVVVGEPDSTLRGEVFTMSAGKWVFQGYQERNYGASALYADRSLTIDASALPRGITLAWAGGDASHARVLAVYGDLTLNRVAVAGGHAVAAPLPGNTAQPYTLARGAGVAVWGVATLVDCVFAGNRAEGDVTASRDRGAFGGAVYADTVDLTGCVVSGNSTVGYGAAGGGVYSVGGALSARESRLSRSAITGNRVTAQHAYGGGVYSDGGGPGMLRAIGIGDCTIARNLVEDHGGIDQSTMTQYYYRGGGFYMSNGKLTLSSSTIAQNAVSGIPAIFGGKPNMGGGGIAATIGNAHVVESMDIRHSIVAGNTLNGAPSDVFTGSLVDFYSSGHNLFGDVDFSPLLVPVPSWHCLNRRHYPEDGDRDGVALDEALDLESVGYHDAITSAGTDAGGPAVLWYPPRGIAVDRIPPSEPKGIRIRLGYAPVDQENPVDDFPSLVLDRIQARFGFDLRGENPGLFDDLSAVDWYPTSYTWPADPRNASWIAFWRNVDAAIGERLGATGLGKDFWGTFAAGPFGQHVALSVASHEYGPTPRSGTDQLGGARFEATWGDVGAVERADAVWTPVIAESPIPLPDFGPVNLGLASGEQTATFTNGGTAHLAIGTIAVAGVNTADFDISHDGCSGRTIAPGDHCTVGVVFAPRALDARDALLIVPSNDPARGTLSLALRGTGIDSLPPAGSVTINGGAAATRRASCSLTLAALDLGGGPIRTCVSNTETCRTWTSLRSSRDWTLPAGDGTKTVRVWFRDRFGNTSAPHVASIVLDGARPADGAVAVARGDARLTLDWNGFADAGSGIAGYRVAFKRGSSAPSSCSDGTRLASAGMATSLVHAGLRNGTTYSYRVCAADAAGNVSAGATGRGRPVPETNPPTGTVTINGGAPTARSTQATLSLTLHPGDPADGAIRICVSNTPVCGSWQPFTATRSWTLAGGDGVKTVSVWFRDQWGNTSAPHSDTILLDTAAPTNGTVTATPGDTRITLDWSGFADTGSGIAGYRAVFQKGGAPSSCGSGSPVPGYDGTATTLAHDGLANGALYGYRICALDAAGNRSPGGTVTGRPAP